MPGQMGMGMGMGGMGGMGGMQQPGMGMGMGGMMPGQGMGGMPGMSQPQQSQAPPASVAVAGVQPSVVPPAQEKVTVSSYVATQLYFVIVFDLSVEYIFRLTSWTFPGRFL